MPKWWKRRGQNNAGLGRPVEMRRRRRQQGCAAVLQRHGLGGISGPITRPDIAFDAVEAARGQVTGRSIHLLGRQPACPGSTGGLTQQI